MVNVISGDILKSGANVIVHQVNCRGVMGAGLARQIKEKYPEAFTKYKTYCDSFSDKSEMMGTVLFVTCMDGTVIANVFGQLDFGRNGRKTDYHSLKRGLNDVRKYAEKDGLSVAIPHRIGCGLAGGNWNIVYKMITSAFDNYGVTLYEYK